MCNLNLASLRGLLCASLLAVTPVFAKPGTLENSAMRSRILESYGKLPLSFIENRGQAQQNIATSCRHQATMRNSPARGMHSISAGRAASAAPIMPASSPSIAATRR